MTMFVKQAKVLLYAPGASSDAERKVVADWLRKKATDLEVEGATYRKTRVSMSLETEDKSNDATSS